MNRYQLKNIHLHVIQHRIHQVENDNFNLVAIIISNGIKKKLDFLLERIFVFCRGSGQNSRTSSVAESTGINTEGFSNYTEILQHLQTGSLKINTIQISVPVFFSSLE